LKLIGINRQKVSLSIVGGFRKSVKFFCDEHCIRGWIRRTPIVHAEIYLEGTIEQHSQFRIYLDKLVEQEIIESYSPKTQLEPVLSDLYSQPIFSIKQNSSCFVVNGTHSGHEFDKASQSTADREQFIGARSPHSSDR
jgi:hypothetical protein